MAYIHGISPTEPFEKLYREICSLTDQKVEGKWSQGNVWNLFLPTFFFIHILFLSMFHFIYHGKDKWRMHPHPNDTTSKRVSPGLRPVFHAHVSVTFHLHPDLTGNSNSTSSKTIPWTLCLQAVSIKVLYGGAMYHQFRQEHPGS